jgi:hypothetical protein
MPGENGRQNPDNRAQKENRNPASDEVCLLTSDPGLLIQHAQDER